MSNWTPGPWPISEQWMGGIKRGPFHIGRPNHAHVNGKANAELIALAPEMAEALLNYANCQEKQFIDCAGNRYCHAAGECVYLMDLKEVTDKLRAIVGDNE